MLAYARHALDYIGGLTAEEFAQTYVLVHATTRAAEVVGEAASQVPADIRQTMPTIPWRQAIGMRNKLIHGYRALQASTLFETIRDDFPPLIAEIERLLQANP